MHVLSVAKQLTCSSLLLLMVFFFSFSFAIDSTFPCISHCLIQITVQLEYCVLLLHFLASNHFFIILKLYYLCDIWRDMTWQDVNSVLTHIIHLVLCQLCRAGVYKFVTTTKTSNKIFICYQQNKCDFKKPK